MERMRAFQNIYKPIFLINSLQTSTALTLLTTMLTPYTPNTAHHRGTETFSVFRLENQFSYSIRQRNDMWFSSVSIPYLIIFLVQRQIFVLLSYLYQENNKLFSFHKQFLLIFPIISPHTPNIWRECGNKGEGPTSKIEEKFAW